MPSRSTLHPKRDCSSPNFQLCSKSASGCVSSNWSHACAPSWSPAVTARAASDKLRLTRARKPFREANRQRRRAIDREVVQPDEPLHPPVEPRLEDVVAVAALAWLRIQRHTPHVVGGATPSLGILDRPPVEEVAGLEVLGVAPRAAVEVNQLWPEEEHHGPGQQAFLVPGEVNTNLPALAEEGEQILIVGAAADGELLAGGGLLEQFVEAVHRRRSFRSLHGNPLLD